MISRPVTVSPVNAIFAIRLFEASARPISAPGPLTTFSTPGGTMSSITSQSFRIDHGVGLAGLTHRAVAGGQRRGDLPGRHQQREVERDDLADDAERLAEVVGVGLLVDLGDPALLARGSRRRSSGSGRPRAGCRRRASRAPACRSPSSRRPRASRGWPRSRRRSALRTAARSAGDVAPQASLAACAASSASSMSAGVGRRRPRRTAGRSPGVRFSRYSPSVGATHSPPMKLS